MILGCWEVELLGVGGRIAIEQKEKYQKQVGKKDLSGKMSTHALFPLTLPLLVPDSLHLNTEVYPSLWVSLNKYYSQLEYIFFFFPFSCSASGNYPFPISCDFCGCQRRNSALSTLCFGNATTQGTEIGPQVSTLPKQSQSDPFNIYTMRDIDYSYIYFFR